MKMLSYISQLIELKKSGMCLLLLSFLFATQVKSMPLPSSNLQAVVVASGISKDVPIDAVFYNPCCDEDVYISGNALLVINNNIIHVVVSDLTGSGLASGLTYTGRGPSVETNVFYANQNEGTLTFKMHMINSDGCSFRLKATFRLEVNANGDTVVSFQNFDVKC